MSMQDPIADLLTRIRNGHAAKKESVAVSFSKIKLAVVSVLKDEGYIDSYKIVDAQPRKQIEIQLKYYNDAPVITSIDRVSRPGLRQYRTKDKLPKVLGGLGVAIVSTTKGVMSDRQARLAGHGFQRLA